jgi:hypothetical protein
MTDVVISGLKYRGIEKLPLSQLQHLAGLIGEAIANYQNLISRYQVANILYAGKTHLQQLNDAVAIIDQVLLKRKVN